MFFVPIMSVFEWASLLATMKVFLKFVNKLFENILGVSNKGQVRHKRLVWFALVTFVPTLRL